MSALARPMPQAPSLMQACIGFVASTSLLTAAMAFLAAL
jgi:hypothetical protein